MRNLRRTLPTEMAWGTTSAGARADVHLRWSEAHEIASDVAEATGWDDGLLSLDLLKDGEALHVIDLRPHLGLAGDQTLSFAGMDVGGLALDLATGIRSGPNDRARSHDRVLRMLHESRPHRHL